MPRPIPARRALRRLAPALAAGAALAAATAPAVAHADDALTLSDTTTTIAPGITLRSFQTLSASGWLKAKVLTADLSAPTLHSDMLTASPFVTAAAPLSQTATNAGAIAAINGDFFNIGDTNATSGFELRGDTLLKSSNAPGSRTTVAGVDGDGIGRLADLTLSGTAVFKGSNHPIKAVNSPAPPANSIDLITPDWGAYTRNSGVFKAASPKIEVIVGADGTVVAKSDTPTAAQLAPGSYALVAYGATTKNLDALSVGDPVSISYGVSSTIAQKLQYAIGGAVALVRNGVVPAAVHYDSPSDEVDVQGRPALGFKDGGRTMLLVVVDGHQSDVPGLTAQQMAAFMKSLGADDALLFDGGGSAELVARDPGDSAVSIQNTPSDGAERPVPNGIGLFAQAGDGTPHQLIVSPGGADARVFPGLHRTFAAKATDDQDAPVAVAAGDVRWSADAGDVDGDGVLAAPADAAGTTIALHASDGGATQATSVRACSAGWRR